MATTTTTTTAATSTSTTTTTSLHDQLLSQATSPAHHARLLCRHNLLTNTSGAAPGYLQANLIILPSAYAGDFHALCLRNPVSCPLLGHTPEAGNPHKIVPEACITTSDFDLRTDFARYRVYEHGRFVTGTTDLRDVWTADHVGFLIGCSFSFEDALTRNGLQPRHQLTNTLVAMYRSSIPVLPAGVFTGATCVVSMRPYRAEDVERVRALTRPYLSTHGEPVAWGWDGADAIGVKDVAKVDFGMPQRFEEGEVPVFWACGVTPQLVIESAGDKVQGLVFAHEPGDMLVTDWTTQDLERLKGGAV